MGASTGAGSALGWAHTEGVLERDPLDGMRGPPQPGVRQHAPVDAIRAILAHVAAQTEHAAQPVQAFQTGSGTGSNAPALARLHRAEQVLLLVRLAADSGARRGELAALQVDDLDRNVLTITRAASNEQIGPTKSGRVRRLPWARPPRACGATPSRPGASEPADFGPWLFSRQGDHAERLTTSTLGHWFAMEATEAGHADVPAPAPHTVATTLVGQGDILGAQYRLGHRDASTTLRIYAHAMPLTDADAAQTLDRLYAPS